MRIRGDSAFTLAVLAIGFAPALLKKSKPLARYLGDQFIRAGEYLKTGSEEEAPEVTVPPTIETDPEVIQDAAFEPEVVIEEVVIEEVPEIHEESGEGEGHPVSD